MRKGNGSQVIWRSGGDRHPNLDGKANNWQFLARATEEALPWGAGCAEHGRSGKLSLEASGPGSVVLGGECFGEHRGQTWKVRSEG